MRATLGISVVALAAAGLASPSADAGGQALPATGEPDASLPGYINYAAPRAESVFTTDERLDESLGASAKGNAGGNSVAELSAALEQKYGKGNPVAARGLAKLENKSIRTGKSPKSLKRTKTSKTTQEAKLLTILVEFNDEANDDFTGSYVPEYWGASTCKPGEVVNGPLHNTIPDPAEAPELDNNSMWVEDFSSEHFNRMLFSNRGITERIRTDLTGPDGKPGIDISGYTMKRMYEEMSHGAYTVTGEATPWVTVPHSEGWYGATTCYQDETGAWVAGAYQGMQGHPDNPLGAGQLPVDAVAALAAAQPDFPWAEYDVEDQGDRDGDGNFNEPDGVIDHVVLVHAGADKSGGGGAEGTYAIWAHSSAVAGGASIPGTDLKLYNYIVQPEDSGVGVFAHEYGHDLGLPDLYDVSGAGSSDVDFWDLMSSGSHSGPIFQSMPTHMGLWDKWVLGWADPEIIDPGDPTRTIKVGQSSRPAKGTEDGIKVNLPDKVITLTTPHSGDGMWYTGADQDWADIRLSRALDVPAAADAKLWMWNDYVIEQDWDYGFVEVSTDGGATWSELKVYAEDGTEVTTSDAYGDPNGNMATFGGKRYGLTGDSGGWVHEYVDLTPYAGTTVQLRLRQATDAAYLDRGWFADDFALVADGATVWSDDVEGGANGWTGTVSTFVDTTGPGWRIDTGTSVKAQYYLVEWRNFDGFDEGLKYAYNTVYNTDDAWKVEKVAYNAPGALVWYRDTTYGNSNQITANETALPAFGAKGGLLIVDSHFDPLRRTGAAAAADPSTLDVMPSRAQSSNAAFGLVKTRAFKECFTLSGSAPEYCTTVRAQPAVSTFTDDQGWVPGLAYNPANGGLYYRDRDASVVVPSVDNQAYTLPIYDMEGNPFTPLYGESVAGFELGTGDPADSGVGYGTVISVKKAMPGNTAALIRVTPPAAG
ncbi:immune inhibitor A domain-containing protein [Demequina iriomotensis]|uniref:immune inhibitor A domain-containing protein n=1 Tax=Demequina iriomotensis TaxID=1536641 RepID=UPI0009E24266|nr:immune inhibitor A domain-containing protein [Demequina iriomotensis]